MAKAEKTRCAWAVKDPLMRQYHDQEWGVPETDSRALWELLMLEGFQAGLSWIVVLRKREAFQAAFAGFDPEKVARFGEAEVARLMDDPAIIGRGQRSRRRSRERGFTWRCGMRARILGGLRGNLWVEGDSGDGRGAGKYGAE